MQPQPNNANVNSILIKKQILLKVNTYTHIHTCLYHIKQKLINIASML